MAVRAVLPHSWLLRIDSHGGFAENAVGATLSIMGTAPLCAMCRGGGKALCRHGIAFQTRHRRENVNWLHCYRTNRFLPGAASQCAGRLAVVLALLLGVLVRSETAAEKASTEAWPIFRGAPSLTGISNTRLPEKLQLLWNHECGEEVSGSAIVADGRVYLATRAGTVIALSFETGKLMWKRVLKTEIRASPSCFGGRLLVGDMDGVLHALDGETGVPVWKFEARQQIMGSANCIGDRVVFGSYDYSVYCLDLKDGHLVWRYETDAQVHATPCITNGQAVVGGCDGMLRVIDLKTGKELKTREIEANIAASPAFNGSTFFLGTFSGAMLAVRPSAEKPVFWRREDKDGDTIMASAAATAKRVVFAGRDGVVQCRAADTGKSLWRFRTKRRVDSSPVVVGDRVFVGSDDGWLYALDLKSGRKRWGFAAGAAIPGAPAVASNRLVAVASDGAVYCFGATGQ